MDIGDTLTPLLQSSCHQGSVLGVYEVEHRATQHVSDRSPEHFGNPGVGECCSTLRVKDPDAFEGCLDNPPESLRPGLSATAKIQTAQKQNVLSIPIQALAERTQKELDEAKNGTSGNVTLAASTAEGAASAKTDIQGVFVVRDGKAQFVPVQTGISGVTDIEIASGIHEGDVIVTGSYKALRTLKPGASVKVDNSTPKSDDASSSSSS